MLRDEPQYRLLFGGQVLSIIGDRVTAIVLPFAVLLVGGHVGDVAIVSAAQFLPFAVLALPAGVWADRLDRKKILITSDAVRLVCQLTAATLLLTGPRDGHPPRRTRRFYGGADAFFAPTFTGLLPGTVAPANLQPANALIGLSYSTGSIAGPALAAGLVAAAAPAVRCSSTRRPSPSRSSVSSRCGREPCGRAGRGRDRGGQAITFSAACATAGRRCAAGHGSSPSSAAWRAITRSCCRRSSCSARCS